jgi:PREDICTED: mitochondrial carrier homolog 2-like
MIKESLCQIVALTASYPFTVLVKRSFAQFIGQDTIYYSFSTAIFDIYQNEGLAGFYAGFVPHLIQDIIVFWASRHLLMLIPGYKLNPEDTTGFGVTFTSFLLQPFLYPFQLVSTVMTVNSCASLGASRIYPRFGDWKECWSYLQSINHLKRGSSLIWRYQF